MAHAPIGIGDGWGKVVGSFGSRQDLCVTDAATVRAACDLAEIRLDLLQPVPDGGDPAPWRHLRDVPLLFTARRQDEGGAWPLSAAQRQALLESVLAEAAWIDIEVASLGEMRGLLATLAGRRIPWLASFHDFTGMPAPAVLESALQQARDAGASAFKTAVRLHQPADLARLAEFQLADHGIPVASMGMGPLAAVSRLLCAQCGSIFNYGYLGVTATAPGQWSAAQLRQALGGLAPWTPQG